MMKLKTGVEWQPQVLKAPHQSDTPLHELARETRGIEKRRGKTLTALYGSILTRWETESKQLLRPGHDYLTDLLATLDRVTVPKSETLKAAFARAKAGNPSCTK